MDVGKAEAGFIKNYDRKLKKKVKKFEASRKTEILMNGKVSRRGKLLSFLCLGVLLSNNRHWTKWEVIAPEIG